MNRSNIHKRILTDIKRKSAITAEALNGNFASFFVDLSERRYSVLSPRLIMNTI